MKPQYVRDLATRGILFPLHHRSGPIEASSFSSSSSSSSAGFRSIIGAAPLKLDVETGEWTPLHPAFRSEIGAAHWHTRGKDKSPHFKQSVGIEQGAF